MHTSADCADALKQLTRRPWQLRGCKLRPYVGTVAGAGGRLWYGRRQGLSTSARSFSFAIVSRQGGCDLVGDLSLTKPLRIFTCGYFLFCIVAGVLNTFLAIVHRNFIGHVFLYLLFAVCFGFTFMYGYGWFAVRVGRKAEKMGLLLMQHTLDSQDAAAVVRSILEAS